MPVLTLTRFSQSIPTPAPVTYSLYTGVADPAATYDDGDYELGIKFFSTVPGQITAFRFFKAALETGTHTGKLWLNSAPATPVATATYENETPTGWQQVNLPIPVNINADIVYTISCNVNTKYVATSLGLQSQLVSGTLKTVLTDNGVYNETPNTYPSTPFQSDSYYMDIVFKPE